MTSSYYVTTSSIPQLSHNGLPIRFHFQTLYDHKQFLCGIKSSRQVKRGTQDPYMPHLYDFSQDARLAVLLTLPVDLEKKLRVVLRYSNSPTLVSLTKSPPLKPAPRPYLLTYSDPCYPSVVVRRSFALKKKRTKTVCFQASFFEPSQPSNVG